MDSTKRSLERFPDGTLVATLLALAGVILVFEVFTRWDLAVQDLLFRFERGAWLVDARAPLPRLLCYTGPKALVTIFGIALVILLLVREASRPRWLHWLPARPVLAVTVLTLALTPITTGILKSISGVPCPWSVDRYGGTQPYVRLFDPKPEITPPDRPGKCWPSGHASGGFALLSLVGWWQGRRRAWGLAIGLSVGGLMGGYQMAKGAHYLSHVLVTALLAWLWFLLARRLVRHDLGVPGPPPP